jgi:Isocitrate/isopropylmalate dehydrogenase
MDSSPQALQAALGGSPVTGAGAGAGGGAALSLPSPPELSYLTAENAIGAMMQFAKDHGYGMSLKRSKPDGKDAVKTRYYYHCDRHGNYAPRGQIRERTSRSTGCLFQVLIQKLPEAQCWTLKVKNGAHNHGPNVVDRSSAAAQKRKVKVWKIALIPGDGIGVEVVESAVTVLQRLAFVTKKFEFQFKSFEWNSKEYLKTGKYIPADGIAQLKMFDAILFGAVGSPGESFSIYRLHADSPKTCRTTYLCGD